MSADNGIYVAKFSDGIRVTYGSAVDNIDYYYEGSAHWKRANEEFFREAPVFKTFDTALVYASYLDEYHGETEYGVVYLGERPLWFNE